MKTISPADLPLSVWASTIPEQRSAMSCRMQVLHFAQEAHRALPDSTLPWSQWHRVHQDLGYLILEARSESPRSELVRVLMQLVIDELSNGGPPPPTLRLLESS